MQNGEQYWSSAPMSFYCPTVNPNKPPLRSRQTNSHPFGVASAGGTIPGLPQPVYQSPYPGPAYGNVSSQTGYNYPAPGNVPPPPPPKFDRTKYGWLQTRTNTVHQFPQNLSHLCFPFVMVGKACSQGKACRKAHVYHCELTRVDLANVSRFVNDTPGLDYQKNSKNGGTDAVRRRRN